MHGGFVYWARGHGGLGGGLAGNVGRSLDTFGGARGRTVWLQGSFKISTLRRQVKQKAV